MPLVDNEVNAKLLANLIVGYGRLECAVVERQQSMPKQGVASSFKTGVGYGIIIGVLAALDIPAYFLSPTQWKKMLHLSKDKEVSRQEGPGALACRRRLLPAQEVRGSRRGCTARHVLVPVGGAPGCDAHAAWRAAPPQLHARLVRRYQEGVAATVE